jgi:hypothetical protein
MKNAGSLCPPNTMVSLGDMPILISGVALLGLMVTVFCSIKRYRAQFSWYCVSTIFAANSRIGADAPRRLVSHTAGYFAHLFEI